MKGISELIGSNSFWENGIVMLVVSAVVGILVEIVVFRFAGGKKRLVFLPALICVAGIIFSVIMLAFPNGTGGVTHHFYFGILMYLLCISIISLICGSILLLLKKHTRHSSK